MDPHNPIYGEAGALYGVVYYSAGPTGNPNPKKGKSMAEIKQTLSRFTVSKLIEESDKQNKLMAPAAPATPPIPNMAATIADQVTAHDEAKTASEAYEAAKAALGALKTARDEKADALRAQMAVTQAKAQAESKGEPGPLQAAGYQIASDTPAPSAPLGQPQNLAVTAGDADASLDVSCDPPSGAKTFEWQITTADPVAGPYVTVKQTTASSATLTGLTSGQRVWVRVRAIGTKGEGPWSDPATKIVP